MSSITEIQETTLNAFKKAICESVEAIPVNKEAIKITTPFIDWKGYPVGIYVTKEGKITDGKNTISQLRSLRVFEEFQEWQFQDDYFQRYQIQRIQDSLEPSNPESKDALLSYLQGIARIPGLFEPKPIYSSADNYPTIAIGIAAEGLQEKYQLSAMETRKYLSPREIILNTGLSIKSDLSPKNNNFMIKIISHASSTNTDKRQHVGYKLYETVQWKRENPKVQLHVILQNKSVYPEESQRHLESEAKKIIETNNPDSKYEIAELLIEG